MGEVDNETTVSEVTVTTVDLAIAGVDPDSFGSVRWSSVSNGGVVEGSVFGSLGHANMSDSDVGNLGGAERDSAEHALTGVPD